MNALQLVNKYLHPYRQNGHEVNPVYCPFCRGGQKRDKYSFFLNLEKETFICHRSKCGKQGHLTQLLRYFGEEKPMEIYRPVKNYKKPILTSNSLPEDVINYAALRKISKQTLEDWKVLGKDGNVIHQYFDENNELVFLKYRPARKLKEGERKAWREKDAKPILYGMWRVDNTRPLVITEGEFDTLSVHEAGYKNVVSVPSGSKDFEWVDNCWEWLSGIKKIILWGDNDEPGREMVKSLIAKIGEEKCYIVDAEMKDANELLYRKGPDAVINAIENAKPVPFEGLIDLSAITPENDKDMPKIKSNIKWLDKLIGGWLLGELSIWTGKRGEGKSTFLGQVILEALDQGESVCAYSGELTARRFQDWVHRQAAGPENIEFKLDYSTGKEYPLIQKEVHDQIRQWYKGRLFLYDNTINFHNSEENSIIRVFSYAVRRYDCKLFLVDNLMTARFDGIDERDYYRRQSEFVGELVRFAKSFNVHVHLVAHPKKTSSDLDNDDISGTADITNRADNVFSVKRVDKEVDAEVKLLKNRSDGIRGKKLGFKFDEASKRFWMPSEPESRLKRYGWESVERWQEENWTAPWDN